MALYLLAATAPLEVYRTAVAKLDISLFRLSLLIAIGVLLTGSRNRWHQVGSWLRQPLVIAYLWLGVVVLLAMLVNPIRPFLGEREAAQIVVGAVAVAVIAELARHESMETVASAIVIGSALPILGAAWQALAPELGASGALPLLSHLPAAEGLEVTRQAVSSFGPIGSRAKGTFGDPNHFGVYLGFVVCFAAALSVLAGQRRNRIAQVSYGAMTVAAAAAVEATFSRTAWIALVVAALVIGIGLRDMMRTNVVRRPKRRTVVLASVCAVGLIAGVAPSVAERATPSSTINKVSDKTHASTVRFAFHQFTKHPILGIGPGGLGVKLRQPTRTSGAHSTYLTTAAELGILGLAALLTAAAVALRLLARAWRTGQGGLGAVLPVALTGAYCGFLAANVTYDLWYDDFHWIVLGAVAAIAAKVGHNSASRAADPAEVPAQSSPQKRAPAIDIAAH